MSVRLWPATAHDLERLALGLRASDAEEVFLGALARFGVPVDPADCVRAQWADMARGDVFAMRAPDGVFLGLCGVTPAPLDRGLGAIWLLGTEDADLRPVALTRCAKSLIALSRRRYRWLGNVVPSHFTARQRWLDRLGFDIAREKADGPRAPHVSFGMWGIGPEDRAAAPETGTPALPPVRGTPGHVFS